MSVVQIVVVFPNGNYMKLNCIPLYFSLFQDYNEYFRDLDVSIMISKSKKLLV